METLASVWARDPCDPPSDLREERHSPATVWESPAGLQLSPHLQRNKQLQDALLQRDEELQRLQDENNELREFLSSSFVRNLEEKAKKLCDGGRTRRQKRNRTHVDAQDHAHDHAASKRVRRNLTAEFCSEAQEPNLDLWVLRTLGLKDRDTIDTSDGSVDSGLGSLVSSSSSCGLTVGSFGPSALGYSQSSAPQTEPRSSAAGGRGAVCGASAQKCSAAPGRRSDFTAAPTWSRRHDSAFTLSPHGAEVWFSPEISPTPLSPPGERIRFSPGSCSSPVMDTPPTPPTPRPRGRPGLAFSMSLSPSSSVKTHSYPQGQAFTSKDTEGGWSFTWLPRQGP